MEITLSLSMGSKDAVEFFLYPTLPTMQRGHQQFILRLAVLF